MGLPTITIHRFNLLGRDVLNIRLQLGYTNSINPVDAVLKIKSCFCANFGSGSDSAWGH